MILTARVAPGARRTPGDWSATAAAFAAAGVTALVLAEAAPAPEGAAAPLFEASTLAGRLAITSPGLGLIAADTASNGFPYNVARRLATVDHLAAGCAGWHLTDLTSVSPEFADVVLKLWSSWEPGAERADKAARTFHDDDRIHDLDHRGEHFTVLGPLDVPSTPQGRPVVHVDVDGSEEPTLVARFADIAVLRGRSLADVTTLAATVRQTAAAAGRGETLRLVVAVSGSAAPGVLDVGTADDAGALRDTVRRLLDETGADGVELVDEGPGSTWVLDAAAVLLRPSDSAPADEPTAGATAHARHRTLLARLDLDGRAA